LLFLFSVFHDFMITVSTHKELYFISSRVCYRFPINWNTAWLHITQLEKIFTQKCSLLLGKEFELA
jgi:hypothetical protein